MFCRDPAAFNVEIDVVCTARFGGGLEDPIEVGFATPAARGE